VTFEFSSCQINDRLRVKPVNMIGNKNETKTQTEIQINKIDKVQMDIEMIHTQTIMQILVSFFLVTFHSWHPKIIGLILSLSLSLR
jgi:hypothetical protein